MASRPKPQHDELVNQLRNELQKSVLLVDLNKRLKEISRHEREHLTLIRTNLKTFEEIFFVGHKPAA